MTLLPNVSPAPEAVAAVDYGEVFTRRWVVELILDLCGYTADRDLMDLNAIEPSCGSGAFLVPMIERLAESARAHRRDLASAYQAIQARDLLAPSITKSRAAAHETLVAAGVDSDAASVLAAQWVQQGDFLLDPPAPKSADLVVGNPPYIRLEAVPPEISNAYRQACPTMGGRSDVYVGFYEQGLSALRDGGVLGFICADRWMRNAYGARLRELIARAWAVEVIVSMTGVDAFEEEVNAYPAITVLRRGAQAGGPLVVNAMAEFNADDAGHLIEVAQDRVNASDTDRFRAARMTRWFSGSAGWPHGSPAVLSTIADIERRLPTLEDDATGTRVGIGLATGADRIFITEDPSLVEAERVLPLALVRDIAEGRVEWSGHYLVNPWDEDGLVDLRRWPNLRRYLTQHETTLSKRHTARSGKWHKTIDRVINNLAKVQKLYLPDFKEALFPVLDRGETYPHHNLYWITSERWDLEVLGGILLSDIANLFISAYSVRMRGGYLRFQAQYLRRICLPEIDQIDRATEDALRRAFRSRNRAVATEAVLPFYGLDIVPA